MPVTFEEITAIVERKPEYPLRIVHLPRLTTAPFGTDEHEAWVRQNTWMVHFQVFKTDKDEAHSLALELEKLFEADPTMNKRAEEIIARLRELRRKDPQQSGDPLVAWSHSAYQLVNYASNEEVWKAIYTALGKYSGQVLEAMCGHHSYLMEQKGRVVTALDYCRESLERYKFPARRRILCDLNQVQGNDRLHFFSEGQFDAISICFGFKYPLQLDALLKEFRRILKPGGVLSFIENPASGYPKLCKREFKAESAIEIIGQAGFSEVDCKVLPITKSEWALPGTEEFYHVEARK